MAVVSIFIAPITVAFFDNFPMCTQTCETVTDMHGEYIAAQLILAIKGVK